jgi:signal transduction histidine kinase
MFWGALFGAMGMLLLGHILMLAAIRYARVFHFNPGTMTEAIPIALLLIFFGAWHISKGLSPFDRLRARLADMREGKGDRIEGEYPGEVQPLVNDLNALLDHRERTLKRAQTTAGDLAHGLKTPLAVLSHEAERARAAGQPELAATISQQVERMQKQVDYHLAHARAAASGATPGARCLVAASADGLIRTLSRIYADSGITIDSTIPPQHAVQAQREDLDEMLGNLLDNACKWTKSRIAVASSDEGDGIVITVDDDGPGLNPDQRELVLQRGVRADEAAPGSGLGLAIVRDIAELHGGSIVLDKSPMGGVRARLRLQRAL